MKRKKLIAAVGAAVLLAGITTVVTAQRGGFGRGPGAGWLYSQLDLTEEQQEQLRELRQSAREEVRSAWDSEEWPDPEAMDRIRAEHREKMKAILTEEQAARFAELEADLGDRMRARRGGWGRGRGRMHGPELDHMGGHGCRGSGPGSGPGQPGPRGDTRGCQLPHGPGPARDPFARLDLSDEQKAEIKELRAARREEMEKLRNEHREKIESVLTKDQRQKLEELKDDAFYGGGRKPGRRDGKHHPGRP